MKIANISEKEFKEAVRKSVKISSDMQKNLFLERKPYNPPSLYKKASIWNKIVWNIKKVIKL